MPFDFWDSLFLLGFLLFLEVILNVDNMIIIAMIASNVPKKLQKKVQAIGLSLALIFRVCLVFFLAALMKLDEGIIYISRLSLSIKDILMILGGIFLIYKSISSVLEVLQKQSIVNDKNKSKLGFINAIMQIAFIDCVFSIDSIITAISVTKNTTIILIVILISILCLLIFSQMIIKIVQKNQSIKMMAFLFIYLIGLDLFMAGVHIHTNKYFLYLAMMLGLLINWLHFLFNKIKK